MQGRGQGDALGTGLPSPPTNLSHRIPSWDRTSRTGDGEAMPPEPIPQVLV